ncbi:MAG: T9SS type A sorting domain-containing protein [Flavipsychrobacter sp.]
MKSLFTLLFCLLTSIAFGQNSRLDSFNINPALLSPNSNPRELTAFKNRLIFYARDSAHGRQYWETDGIYPPRIINIDNDTVDAVEEVLSNAFTILDDKVYFAAKGYHQDLELWEYDGNKAKVLTPLNFNQVPINLDPNGHFSSTSVTGLGERFVAFSDKRKRFCSYNIKTRVTNIISDIEVTGPIIDYRGDFHFSGHSIATGQNGLTYYYTPKTNATVPTGTGVGSVSEKFIRQEMLYIIQQSILYTVDGNYRVNRLSYSYPFTYDFDSVNFNLISNRSSMCTNTFDASNGGINDKFYFSAVMYQGKLTLFEVDIFKRKATTVSDSFLYIGDMAYYNGRLFFSAKKDTLHGIELYVYNGITPPSLLADIHKGPKGSNPHSLTVANNRLFFVAEGETIGEELFCYTEASATANISNLTTIDNITVFPNPTSGNTQLRLDIINTETLTISLINTTGQTVYQTKEKNYSQGSHNIILPTARLTTGIYIYRVVDKDGATLASGRVEKQ